MKKLSLAVACLALLVAAAPASANHSWNGYHWGRTASPFTLKLGDDVATNWDAYLSTTSSDWSQSTVLQTAIVAGSTTGRRCRATSGRVEVCDATYGNNGWLGLASIWASGSHITQGTVKLNDTYFNTSKYNKPAWRNMVSCQEVGHTFGLDHQDENFSNTNLGTCMDYTNDPSGTAGTNGTLDNEHPNAHDYEELGIVYGHLDGSNTFNSSAPATAPSTGRVTRVRDDLYVEDFGGGNRRFTFVFWTQPGNHYNRPADA